MIYWRYKRGFHRGWRLVQNVSHTPAVAKLNRGSPSYECEYTEWLYVQRSIRAYVKDWLLATPNVSILVSVVELSSYRDIYCTISIPVHLFGEPHIDSQILGLQCPLEHCVAALQANHEGPGLMNEEILSAPHTCPKLSPSLLPPHMLVDCKLSRGLSLPQFR